MKRGNLLILLFGLALLAIPLISAASWGYYDSPLDYLDNEWVVFGIVFLVFFAIIYYTVNRAFKNPAVSGVIGLGLALMIAMVITRRGLLYGYAGEQLGSWILIVTILIGVGFLLRFIYESFGKTGTAVALIGIWILIRSVDPYDILPYELLTDTFINTYEFFASWLGGIVLVVGGIILLNVTDMRTIGEKMMKVFSKRRIH
tara:strand:- start:1769 stop:2374 length:606 start_codon:yes stop_codon:yes gene_type:complete